jgi:hypothetical protein
VQGRQFGNDVGMFVGIVAGFAQIFGGAGHARFFILARGIAAELGPL